MGPIARRTLITTAAAAAALALAACNNAKGGAVDVREDMSLGQASAKVTLIEYASPTCPHCAAWNEEVFPEFKRKYVDTGQVRYVLREAPIHGAPDVAVFMLGRCAGKDKYFNVVDGAMRTLPELQATGDMRAWVFRVGQSAGMSESQIQTCLDDEKAVERLNERANKGMEEFKVNQTPTFVLNGKVVETPGAPTLAQLSAMIDPLLK